jgi:hypothetical protein
VRGNSSCWDANCDRSPSDASFTTPLQADTRQPLACVGLFSCGLTLLVDYQSLAMMPTGVGVAPVCAAVSSVSGAARGATGSGADDCVVDPGASRNRTANLCRGSALNTSAAVMIGSPSGNPMCRLS